MLTKSNELSEASALIGEEWSVDTIANLALVEDSRATLHFGPDGNLTGNISCNLVFASYEVDGSELKITTAGGTRLMCADAVMEQEQELRALVRRERSRLPLTAQPSPLTGSITAVDAGHHLKLDSGTFNKIRVSHERS